MRPSRECSATWIRTSPTTRESRRRFRPRPRRTRASRHAAGPAASSRFATPRRLVVAVRPRADYPSGTEATPWRVPLCVKRVLPVLAAAALLAPASQARPRGADSGRARYGGDDERASPSRFRTAESSNACAMPADPENVEAERSDRSSRQHPGSSRDSSSTSAVCAVGECWRGFDSPHIAADRPRRTLSHVTDDARGQLVVIDLERRRVTRRVYVGYGAHHMTEDRSGQLALDRPRRASPVDRGRGRFESGTSSPEPSRRRPARQRPRSCLYSGEWRASG